MVNLISLKHPLNDYDYYTLPFAKWTSAIQVTDVGAHEVLFTVFLFLLVSAVEDHVHGTCFLNIILRMYMQKREWLRVTTKDRMY